MTQGARTLAMMGLGLALSLVPAAARADLPAAPNAGTPEAVAEAKVHFTKGRDLYASGAYREAIGELEAARALDPKAKDLVFNLGVVHEKLGEIDDALRFFRLYVQMDLEAAERTRAENYIKRLEGAKAELDAKRAALGSSEEPKKSEPVKVRGRLDTATIAAGAVAIGAVAAGSILGVKALVDQPSNFVAGKDGTVATDDSQQSSAHTEAIVADVCFGGAAVAAAVALGLYFGRYKDAGDASHGPAKASFLLTVTPLVRSEGGGGLLFGGKF